MNIVGRMRGGAYEQDTSDMNAALTAQAALNFKEHVVGFRWHTMPKGGWWTGQWRQEISRDCLSSLILEAPAFAPLS